MQTAESGHSVSKVLAEGLLVHPSQKMRDLPIRMFSLPMAERNGYWWIVPWFVAWVDGVPEFRAADARKWQMAVRGRFCWVCGHKLGQYLVFVLGPMCTITRTTSEPACHLECARWSARSCPFLAHPRMARREGGEPAEMVPAPGMAIARNPGASALWTTRSFELFPDPNGRQLIRVGPVCQRPEWYSEGREATRAEVQESFESGYPLLQKIAAVEGPEAMAELGRLHRAALDLIPRA